jgi:hypothetical protein
METNERITQLESELKIIKNEVQSVLLDIRDKYLEAENPFNTSATTTREHTIIDHKTSGDKTPNLDPNKDKNNQANKENSKSLGEQEIEKDKSEQFKKDWLPEMTDHGFSRKDIAALSTPDLITISALVRWADVSLKKLGRIKTETILDFTDMLGLLTPDMKKVLSKLITIDDTGKQNENQNPDYRNYLDSLIEITSLLGKDNHTEKTMLTIISGEADHR